MAKQRKTEKNWKNFPLCDRDRRGSGFRQEYFAQWASGLSLLPGSPGLSTNIPTRIRYGEKERLIITTSRGRSIEPGIRTMKKDFFEELLQYICEAYELFGLEHLTYFTDKPLWNQYGEGKGTLGPGDLDFHISSPKHKTVMLLILFLFYTDQKENEEILPDEIRQIIRKGEKAVEEDRIRGGGGTGFGTSGMEKPDFENRPGIYRYSRFRSLDKL